jgi:RNA polymerase sigma factor (sigma-70 family)
LLLRLRDRDDVLAWSKFVELYTPLIQKLARQKGLQEADAADLVQEVFRAVARRIERYDPDPSRGSFRGWLSRIARNLILDSLAARRRLPLLQSGEASVSQVYSRSWVVAPGSRET